MTAANQTLPTLYRGVDAIFTFTAQTPPVGGCAGWTVQLTLSFKGGLTQVSGTITDSVVGVFTFPMLRAATLALPPGNYQFEVARIDAGLQDELANGILPIASTLRDPYVPLSLWGRRVVGKTRETFMSILRRKAS
jgi:hypothetical protein